MIALTISRDTSVYLLDEPFGGVDVIARKKLCSHCYTGYLKKLRCLFQRIIFRKSKSLVDDAIILKDGRLLAYESVERFVKKKGYH